MARAAAGTAKLTDIRTEGVPEATAREVLAQAGVAIGDWLTDDSVKRIQRAAVAMDEHLLVRFHPDRKTDNIVVMITLRLPGQSK